MQALRLLRPSLGGFTTRIPTPFSSSSSSSSSASILRRIQSFPRRPLSQTPRRTNNWPRPPRDPHNYDDPHYRLSHAKPLVTPGGLRRFVRSPSLHTTIVLAVVGAAAFYYSNLQTVPVSGRRRFNCFSEKYVEAASEAQVRRIEFEVEHSGRHFLSEWDPRSMMVRRVMRKLIPVSGIEHADWEIRVIEDPHTANAFVLPGGKVFVFSGLLPIARNESGLATVLGHEIAHNLAEHGGERMSSQIGINILLWSAIFLTGGIAVLGTSFIGGTVLDLLFSRPMGRRQESEADYIGLMMMAEACYDPRQAVGFWQRMETAQKGEPPEWLSTHPSNNNRIQKIQEWMPKALEKMNESDCQGTSAFADLFRRAMQKGVVIV